jgi:CRP-like cAMP-binding protein
LAPGTLVIFHTLQQRIFVAGNDKQMVNEQAALEYLKEKIKAFISIEADDMEAIVSQFECRKIAKDDFLLHEDEYCNFWGFIFEGLVRVYTYTEKAEEYTNGFAREGSFITESASFFTQSPALENMVALEDTLLIVTDYSKLQQLFNDYPVFEKFARILYESRLAEFKRRIHHRIHFDAQTRYLYFIENQPELARRLPLKHIASYLNITDSTLSRIRRKIVHS